MKKNINNLSRARHDAVILIRAGAWRRLRNWIVEWFHIHILFHTLGVPAYIYITHIFIYTLCRERERHGEREAEPRNLFLIFLCDGPHES